MQGLLAEPLYLLSQHFLSKLNAAGTNPQFSTCSNYLVTVSCLCSMLIFIEVTAKKDTPAGCALPMLADRDLNFYPVLEPTLIPF